MGNEIVSFDVETYYDATYSLSKMSVANYVKDPRFDCYLVSVHDKTGPVFIGRPELFDWTKLDGKVVVAHNMSFDYVVLQRLVALGKVPRMPNAVEWACTADMSAWLGCKRSLKDASLILLGEEVSKATRSAMLGKASTDLADNPDVLKYAGKDAELCYRLAEKYLDRWPEKERRISTLNRESGIRGIHTDVALVDSGIAKLEPQLQAAMDKIPWVKDGDKPLSPNALRKHGLAVGISVPASLAKDNPDFLAWAQEYSEKYPWVKAVGEYRSINALLCKVQSIRDGIDTSTGMFPFGIRYIGASTGRFSGGSSGDSGGKVNMQNLPRKSMYGVDVRPMFMARPGHTFITADYAQIEARHVIWASGNEAALAPLRLGNSVYQSLAEAMGLAEPGSDIKHTNSDLYRYAKAVGLGAQYGVGPVKFKSVAKTLAGLELSDEDAAKAIEQYRARNPLTVKLWREHQDALAYSARRKDDTHQVELRSGRILTYWDPRYEGRDISACQVRGAPRSRIYGGLLLENETQASCRDILCDAWIAVDKAGLPPVTLTVHDEIVMEVRKDEAAQIAKELEKCMVTCSPWAEGLPLGVDIHLTDRYTK